MDAEYLHHQSAVTSWLGRISSHNFVLAGFGFLAAAVLLVHPGEVGSAWALTGPLAMLALSLTCAVATNPVFRRQGPLLAFHLALLAIVVLAAIGQLTHLEGRLELAEGEAFTGALTRSDSGPWHRSRLERAQFVNDGFTIRYEKGLRRAETRNRVRWVDEAGRERHAVIGDSEPLVRAGYRFYTSFNKGFAPVFLWHPAGGAPQRGTINLPGYPIHEFRQSLEWTPPGATGTLWTMLRFDEKLLDPEQETHFRLPARHTLVIRIGDARHELVPGASLTLPEGVLTYERLSAWMGYTVFYDWTLPWLLAACVLAAASLAWHFWKKFAAQPWDR